MATTTPNFGWAVPTSSDLVKNGATAIETLGDAIDASMVDLKGGTTGQVLAKATNTDMDFTWTTPSGGSNTFYAGKNKIINGDFGVWQRGTSISLTNNTTAYTCDRFYIYTSFSAGTSSVSRQTFTPGTAPVAGYEGQYFARYTAGSTVTYFEFGQRIENVQTFAGQTATVSFWAKASANTTVSGTLVQNFGSGGSGSVSTGAGSHSVTTSWTRFTATVSVPSISGKTIGSGNYLNFVFASSGLTGSQTIDFWGVQVEAGSSATDFVTASGNSLQAELAMCQRYYFKDGKVVGQDGYAQTATTIYFKYYHPVPMRTTPTYTQTGGASFSSNTSATTFSTDANGSNELSTNFYFLVGASTGYTYLYRPVEWSAEL